MKKIYSILILLVMLCMGFSSCSSDDVEKTPLEAPTLTAGETKVSSLAFNWQPVAGASQYEPVPLPLSPQACSLALLTP